MQAKGTAVRPHYSIEKKETKDGINVSNRMLLRETDSFKKWMLYDVVRDVKESLCHISECRFVEENYEGTPPKVSHSARQFATLLFSITNC